MTAATTVISGFCSASLLDADAASARIIELLDSRRRESRGAAQAKANEQTWERLAEHMEALYLNFLANKGG